MEDEDLIDIVLVGLGDEYISVVDAINARDSPISFPELHEKLLNLEATLLLDPTCLQPGLPVPPTRRPELGPDGTLP